MIEQQTLQLVSNGHWRAARGGRVAISANTPLAEIASTLTVDGVDKDASDEAILEYVNGVEDHTVNLQQAKDLGVRAVRQLSSVVRNTVNPHIRKVVDMVDNSGLREGNDGFGIRITPYKLSPLVGSQLVIELVAKHRVVPVSGTTVDNGVGVFEKEYIFSMLQTSGDTEFHNYSEHWHDESETVLGKIGKILSGTDALESHPNPDIHAAVLVVLHGTKVPPPNTATNLATWELNRNRLMALSAQSLDKIIQKYRMAETTDRLYVNAFNASAREVLVYEGVYKRMLEKGLTVEALMGNEMLNRKFMSHQILDAQAIAVCEAKYRQERTAYETAMEKYEYLNRNRMIMMALTDDLDQIADKESWPVDGDNRDKAKERLHAVARRILDNPRLRDEPTEDIVAAILLATWYAHTDAARLLDIASRICRDDPELGAEEAFTLAKIEYVGLWIASQMRVVGGKE